LLWKDLDVLKGFCYLGKSLSEKGASNWIFMAVADCQERQNLYQTEGKI